jgi:hypothetical protein
MIEYMKVTGSVIISKAVDMNSFRMGAFIKENTLTGNRKESGNIIGSMESHSKGNGSMV